MTSFRSQLAAYGPDADWKTPSPSDAYAYCLKLTSAHYENFSVISWFLPTEIHPHFAAIYAYCRWADDLADEATHPGEGHRLLDWWEHQLEACYAQEAHHPVFVALMRTVRGFDIPIEPLRNLLVAFRQDQTTHRYATYEELLGYCRNSANPVGHLVMYLGRCYSPEAAAYADRVSTGLQLANFWQDVRRDFSIGRIYIPEEDFQRFGLSADAMPQCAEEEAFRQLLAFEVERAEKLLAEGQPIVDYFPNSLKVDIALFVRGGQAILKKVRKQNFDTWHRRPTLGKRTKLRLLVAAYWDIRIRRRPYQQPIPEVLP